jgi:chitinase
LLPDKRFGDGDFTVSASASSGLAVSFSASGNCTVAGATIHVTSAGSCTLTASQDGNANYNAAPDVSRTFQIATQLKPAAVCNVPKVVGNMLAAAKASLKLRHCRPGKVRSAYSAKRKGVVIAQSRRSGKVLPAASKVNLVISRGRKR